MKIAAAQIQPVTGDIAQNVMVHRRWVKRAADEGAHLICFPELSLSGYEPTLAARLAMTPDDERLLTLQRMSDKRKITICAGAPLLSDRGVLIAMIVFQPGQARTVYAKQLLHADELPFFVPGEDSLFLEMENEKMAPAICYESLQTEHQAEATRHGATIYLASVAKSATGVERAMTVFPELARKNAINVVMVNSVGPCDHFFSSGQSAAWSKNGTILAQLSDTEESLLIFNTLTQSASHAPLHIKPV